MDHQDEQRAASNRTIQALVSQVSELTTQLQRLQAEPEQRSTASNPPAPAIPDQAVRLIEPRLPPPAFYSGEPQQCRSFLVFTIHLPPTIVVSYRGIEDSIRHHTALWTGSSLGNYRLGAETSLLHFFFSHSRRRSERCLIGQRGGSFSGGVTAGRSERH